MRDHYDFSKMKGRKNPYIKYLKQPLTMRLDRDTVNDYLISGPWRRKQAFLIRI